MTDRVPLTGEQVAPWLLTRAKSALENWGRHHRWCASLGTTSIPCTCGLGAMIRDLTPTELPPESEQLDPSLLRMALRAAWSESTQEAPFVSRELYVKTLADMDGLRVNMLATADENDKLRAESERLRKQLRDAKIAGFLDGAGWVNTLPRPIVLDMLNAATELYDKEDVEDAAVLRSPPPSKP